MRINYICYAQNVKLDILLNSRPFYKKASFCSICKIFFIFVFGLFIKKARRFGYFIKKIKWIAFLWKARSFYNGVMPMPKLKYLFLWNFTNFKPILYLAELLSRHQVSAILDTSWFDLSIDPWLWGWRGLSFTSTNSDHKSFNSTIFFYMRFFKINKK